MARLAEFDFSSTNLGPNAGFHPGTRGSSVGFVDATAPYSGNRVARFVFPEGPAAGFSTGSAAPPRLPAGTVRVYFAFNWKLSPTFTLHPANLKGWYFYKPGYQGSLVLGWMPAPGASLTTGGFILNGQPQTSGGTPGGMRPNVPNAPVLRRDTWYRTEVLAIMNSSPAVSDGVLQVWVNGVLTINYTDVRYAEGSQLTEWRELHFDPYYGGNSPGHVISTPSFLYSDHAVMSTSTSRR